MWTNITNEFLFQQK